MIQRESLGSRERGPLRIRTQPEEDIVLLRQNGSTPYSLSNRELTVLFLLTEGLADKQIAASLGVSTYTINKHVGSILLKMNVRSRTAAAVRAVRDRVF